MVAVTAAVMMVFAVGARLDVAYASDTVSDGMLVLYLEPSEDDLTPMLNYYPGAPIEIIDYKSANGDDKYWAHVRIGEESHGIDNGSAEGWVYNSELLQYNALPYSLPTAYVNAYRMELYVNCVSALPLVSYKEGTVVKVLGRGMANNTMWSHVLVDGKIGYMNAAYLSFDQKGSTDKVSVGDTALIRSTTGDYVILQPSPGVDAESIGTLYNGVTVHVGQVRPGWIDTKYRGKDEQLANEEPGWDGWVLVYAGEPTSTSGLISGYVHNDDLVFNGTQSDVVSTVPVESVSRVMGLSLTTSYLGKIGNVLRWLSPSDTYEVLGTWSVNSDNGLFIRYTPADGDILTGFIVP
jgi:uncharacterized protein YgiM (DUF1202 family)